MPTVDRMEALGVRKRIIPTVIDGRLIRGIMGGVSGHANVKQIIVTRGYKMKSSDTKSNRNSNVVCDECPWGQYSSRNNSSKSCTTWSTCGKGKARSNGSTTKNATCNNCPTGKYQPYTRHKGGCWSWRTCGKGKGRSNGSTTKNATCFNCPANQYQPKNKNRGGCLWYPSTPPGQFRDGQSSTSKGTPRWCPKGYMCKGAKEKEPGQKIKCPAGQYQNKTGKTECLKCPTGQYQDKKGQTSCKKWKVANYGNYNKDASTIKSGVETPCPIGQYQNNIGQTSCIKCPVGKYQDKEEQKNCPECPTGQYQDKEGQTSCLNIESGYVGKKEKKYNIKRNGMYKKASSGQVPCPYGYYCNNRKMEKCPAGQYQDEKGKEECKSIEQGFYGSNAAESLFGKTIEHFKSREECEEGYYCDGGGGKEVCPVGKQCPRRSSEAKDCPPGEYTNVTGSSKCSKKVDENSIIYKSTLLTCPSDFTPNVDKNDCVIEADWTDGQNHPLKEVVCKKVFENSDKVDITDYKHGDDIVVSCNPGYFGGGKFKCNYGTISGVNNSSGNKSKSCKPCPEGSFQNVKGEYKCVKCMEGTFQDEKGKEKCKLCDINKYQDGEGKTSCKDCDEGEYQDISGAKSCKKFCNDDGNNTQISGPDYGDKLPYGLYEKKKDNDINTYHVCDSSGNFDVLKPLFPGNSYYCKESIYTCGERHLNPKEEKYDGTEINFKSKCCSEFPENKTSQYLNSISCKLTGKMGLEDGYNILDKKGYFDWLKGDGDHSPNHNEDYSSHDNQIRWYKYQNK